MVRIAGRYAGLLLFATLMLATPRGARAFVRYKTSTGLPFAWAQTAFP